MIVSWLGKSCFFNFPKMIKSKLFQLLKKLNKDEFSQLGKFVHSPFFEFNKKITSLYNYIKDEHPNFQSSNLTKQHAAKFVFPNISVTDKRMGNLMSEMYALTLEFLAQMEFQTDKVAKGKLKAEALRKKKMLREYHKEMDLVEEELNYLPARNMNYYADLLYLESKRYASDLQIKHSLSKISLKKMMSYLDKFHALGKLKISSEIISRQNILEESYDKVLFLDEMKELIFNESEEDNPLLKMYYYVVRLGETKEFEYYEKLKSLFFEKYKLIGEENRIDVISYLMNYSTSVKSTNNTQFQEEGFELYKFAFTKRIFHEELLNSENYFQNMIIDGAKLGHFEWIDSFLASIGNNENKGYSEDILVFVKTIVLYEKKEFENARLMILSHQFKRVQDKVRVKSILIRILYEEYCEDDSNHEVLMFSIQAFRKYLKRNKKLPAGRIAPYLNFLKYAKELIRYRFKRQWTIESTNRLKSEVLSQRVANQDWILEKLTSLSKP